MCRYLYLMCTPRQVEAKVRRRVAGEPGYFAATPAGYGVVVANGLGLCLAVVALVLALRPGGADFEGSGSRYGGGEWGGAGLAARHPGGRGASLRGLIIKALRWGRIPGGRQPRGWDGTAGALVLDAAVPAFFAVAFSLPIFCCNNGGVGGGEPAFCGCPPQLSRPFSRRALNAAAAGPFDYMAVQRVQVTKRQKSIDLAMHLVQAT